MNIVNSRDLPMELIWETSTRADGPMQVKENRFKFLEKMHIDPMRLTLGEQVHENSVAYVAQRPETGIIAKIDAMFSDNRKVILGVLHADCFPICIWSAPDGLVRVFGIAHAGFAGTAYGEGFNDGSKFNDLERPTGVAGSLLNSIKVLLSSEGETPDRGTFTSIRSLIGPGICAAHYEIKDDERGLKRFSDRSKYREPPYLYQGNKLDLWAVICDQLVMGGISPKNISGSACNRCAQDIYYSNRSGDKAFRNMTIIGIR